VCSLCSESSHSSAEQFAVNVPPAKRSRQNTQNTCDVHRRARLETRKNFNDKYFVKFRSSPLQSTIIMKCSVHQCNKGHYGLGERRWLQRALNFRCLRPEFGVLTAGGTAGRQAQSVTLEERTISQLLKFNKQKAEERWRAKMKQL